MCTTGVCTTRIAPLTASTTQRRLAKLHGKMVAFRCRIPVQRCSRLWIAKYRKEYVFLLRIEKGEGTDRRGWLSGTLLNRLFGTNFDVMDENQRSQTTKGIWMSRGRGMHVLVMDVEGTDGRERGEDQDFERKSALFSMATSEVIILNIWEHQVGLYQGANMGLLKTVFEVNLQLFQNQKGQVIHLW